MTDQPRARRRSITDRLDALEFKLRADMAGLRTELKTEMAGLRTELKTEMAGLRTDMASLELRLVDKVAGLSVELREFKGYTKGVAIVLTTLLPLATGLAVAGLNYWLLRSGVLIRP